MSIPENLYAVKFLSDEEMPTNYKDYVKNNKDTLKEKLSKINYCTDVPFSMNDGKLFQKFSAEYIQNIIFLKKGEKYQEGTHFNFFDYVQLFTQIKHTKKQKELFEKIISFKNEEAKPDEYFCIGEFDLIINNIKGEDILHSLSKNKFNFYHYPGKNIQNNKTYSIIVEIKLNYFSQIKAEETQKQFKKFKKVIEFLVSKPDLNKIKKKIGLNEMNEIIFMLATNGDFYQFDYMRYSKFYSKEGLETDTEKKYEIPFHLKFIEEISLLNIPVLLLFVPKTLDDNGTIYKNKYVLGLEKKNENLNNEIKELKDRLGKLENIVGKLLGKNNENEVTGYGNKDKLMKKEGNEEIENPNKNFLAKKEKKEESENIFLNKKTKRDSP